VKILKQLSIIQHFVSAFIGTFFATNTKRTLYRLLYLTYIYNFVKDNIFSQKDINRK